MLAPHRGASIIPHNEEVKIVSRFTSGMKTRELLEALYAFGQECESLSNIATQVRAQIPNTTTTNTYNNYYWKTDNTRNGILNCRMKDGYPAFLLPGFGEMLDIQHAYQQEVSRTGKITYSSQYDAAGNSAPNPVFVSKTFVADRDWLTVSGTKTGWWQYEFTEDVLLMAVEINTGEAQGSWPKDWTMTGITSGDSEYTLYSNSAENKLLTVKTNLKIRARRFYFGNNSIKNT